MDAGDLSLQLLVAQRPGRERPALGGVVAGRGDRQQLADRLDPKPVLVTVDVGDHLLGRRSSSLMLLCQAARALAAAAAAGWLVWVAVERTCSSARSALKATSDSRRRSSR